MTIWLLAVAAAAVALWPTGKKGTEGFSLADLAGLEPPPKKTTGYLEAVEALQKVRSRLTATDLLDDEQLEACNVLTLALSAGSDSE